MMKMIKENGFQVREDNNSIAEELNKAYKEGFRFITEGNYRITKGTDPWSGMPNTAQDIFVFKKKEEAEAFAKEQKWVFNKEIHAPIYEIPAHTKTWEELREEEAKAKAEKKAKEAARLKAKAEKEGLTVEEYRAKKNKERNITRVKNEIEELEKELKRKKAYLKKLEG